MVAAGRPTPRTGSSSAPAPSCGWCWSARSTGGRAAERTPSAPRRAAPARRGCSQARHRHTAATRTVAREGAVTPTGRREGVGCRSSQLRSRTRSRAATPAGPCWEPASPVVWWSGPGRSTRPTHGPSRPAGTPPWPRTLVKGPKGKPDTAGSWSGPASRTSSATRWSGTCAAGRPSVAAGHPRDRPAHRHAPHGRAVAGPGGVPRPLQRPGLGVRAGAAVPGAYRAHEMLTAQVAEAMVRAMRRVGRGPVTGLPLAFSITTGDNVDNTQFNELRWQIDLLDGKRIRARLRRPDAVRGRRRPDRLRRPLLAPRRPAAGPGRGPAHGEFGFPRMPGLLDACRRPFHAHGHRHAVADRVRQPRRAGPGQRPGRARWSTRWPPGRRRSSTCRPGPTSSSWPRSCCTATRRGSRRCSAAPRGRSPPTRTGGH